LVFTINSLTKNVYVANGLNSWQLQAYMAYKKINIKLASEHVLTRMIKCSSIFLGKN